MKALNQKEWIAVSAGIALVGFLLYGGIVMNLFNPTNDNSSDQSRQADGESVELPVTGVEFRDVVVGSGAEAEVGDEITVHYVGILTDGRVFDSSLDRNSPFVFTLGAGQVIRGWDQGMQGMRVGGRRQLFIAPDFAYGPNAVGPIPPNSTLVFEVELLGVSKAGAN
jgi:peptidylprolyl isomerase